MNGIINILFNNVPDQSVRFEIRDRIMERHRKGAFRVSANKPKNKCKIEEVDGKTYYWWKT